MRRLALFVALAAPTLFSQEETPDHRLRASTAVLHEIMSAPDRGVPSDLLGKAQCVVIVPGLKKAAIVVGGEYGRGFAVCRNHGTWGGPAAVRFSGGSFGAQIGGESADIVMLVMSRRGMEKLASDKFTIGADASAAAGPVVSRLRHRWEGTRTCPDPAAFFGINPVCDVSFSCGCSVISRSWLLILN